MRLHLAIAFVVGVTATAAAPSTAAPSTAAPSMPASVLAAGSDGPATLAAANGECDDPVPGTHPDAAPWAVDHYDCLAGLEFPVLPASNRFTPEVLAVMSDQYVTRGHLAVNTATFLTNFFDCVASPHPFTDVTAVFTSGIGNDVGCLHRLEITTGTTPPTYSPLDPLTREQIAAFLGRAAATFGDGCPVAPGSIPFTDIPPSSYAYEHVVCLHALGITNGTTPTTYSPDAVVSRDMLATFLGRLWLLNAEFAFP